jgi:cyclase
MLSKRIIPCLDIKNGRTVKGVNFVNIQDAGDPIALATKYSETGADELVFLDISASEERRKTMSTWVREVAKNIQIPFTVGGGISSVDNVEELLKNGADKVSVNSSAVKNPDLLNQISDRFGKQCLVLAIDAKYDGKDWWVYLVGGKEKTNLKLFDWALEGQKRGAGEILFTSMNNDGVKGGFALDALKKLNEILSIPVIASGGAGKMEDFADVFTQAKADAALAASVFHFGEIEIPELKKYLDEKNIPIRI